MGQVSVTGAEWLREAGCDAIGVVTWTDRVHRSVLLTPRALHDVWEMRE